MEDCWCGWWVVAEVIGEDGGSAGDAVVVHGQWLVRDGCGEDEVIV